MIVGSFCLLHHGPSASFPFPSNHTRPRAWQKQFQFDYKHSLLHGNTTQKRKGMVKRKNKNTAAHALALLFFGFAIKGQTLASVSWYRTAQCCTGSGVCDVGKKGIDACASKVDTNALPASIARGPCIRGSCAIPPTCGLSLRAWEASWLYFR